MHSYFFVFAKDNCIGETQNCRFYEEIKINCHYDVPNDCVCDINSKEIPCNSFNLGGCVLPTTRHYQDVSCTEIDYNICTTNGYNFCNGCSKYTIWCFCNWSSSCQFCNISSTTATSTSFPPTGIINTSITSSSHGSVSAISFIGLTAVSHNSRPSLYLITNSLTITSKTSSLILTSPSTVAQLQTNPSIIILTSTSTVAQAKPSHTLTSITTSTVTQVNTEALQVIAVVMPTVCILILGGFGLVLVVFVILYRRKSKQMPVNQRGRTE